MPMADIERWMDLHEAELHALAEQAGEHEDVVRFLASLVLAGSSDDDIYEHLREVTPSWDGQRSPLHGAPHLLSEVRRLVATTS
jgi:hypothetical protein